jgi:hypothetical protein
MKTTGFAVKAAGATSLALLLTTSAFADQTYRRDDNRRERDRAQAQTQTQVQAQPQATQNFNRDNRDTRATRDNRSGSYNRNDNSYNRENRSEARSNTYNRDARTANRSYNYRENERVNVSGRIRSFARENNGYRVYLDGGRAFWVPEAYYRSHARDWRIGVDISLGGIFRGGSIIVGDGGYYPYPAAYGAGYMRGVVDSVDYRRGIAFIRDDRDGRIVEADMRGNRYGRFDALRPGEFVELSGGWVDGNIFAVARIDSIRGGY